MEKDYRVSEHFYKSEMSCPCCGLYLPNSELLDILEGVRKHFSVPIIVNSSTRCEEHNRRVGGAEHSQHLLGYAADIVVKGVDPLLVYEYLLERYEDGYGIGKYTSFTHIDTRNYKARW